MGAGILRERTKTPIFTDPQWADLRKWLPRSNRVSEAATRQTVTAMLYSVRTGVPWDYLAVDLGNPDAVSRTWHRWAEQGIFRRAYHGLFPAGQRNLTVVAIDGRYMPAALEAHGARRIGVDHECHPAPNRCVGRPPLYCPWHQALGRQVNRSTNLVNMADADGELIDWFLLPSNFQEAWATPPLLAGLSHPPGAVIADGRHNTKAVHAAIEKLGSERCIPRKGESKDSVLWRLRNTVERAHNPLLRYLRVALRRDKTAAAYDAGVALAAIHLGLWRRYPSRTTSRSQ